MIEPVPNKPLLVIIVLVPIAFILCIHVEIERFKIRPPKPESRKDIF